MFSTPVILGLVPKILLKQGTNLINKFAILLLKSRFTQDSRNKSENDECLKPWLNLCCNTIKHHSPTGGEVGRSMIEMLGVLAIIAVLSVGGLAGYSKAMLTWNSNIQRHIIAELIADAIELRGNLSKQTEWTNITSTLAAMGNTPEGVEFKNNAFHTKDGMTVNVYYGFQSWTHDDGSAGGQQRYSILFSYIKGDNFSPSIRDFCKNLIFAAKQTASEVYHIGYYGADSNNSSTGWSGYHLYYGYELNNASLADINTKCQEPYKETGHAVFEFILNPY